MLKRTLFIGFMTANLCISAMSSEVGASSAVVQRGNAQLTEQWWQWAMASPRPSSPVSDQTGDHCAVGQGGDTWFLAGGFGSSRIHRKCVVPAGRSIFFPLINMVYWPTRDSVGFSCEQAKKLAALNNETAIDLFAEIDGKSIEGLNDYRIASDRCFNVFSRVPPTQDSYNAYPSATDGYWLLLPPLAPGPHTIKFGGRYNRKSVYFGRMVQDIEYELLVE